MKTKENLVEYLAQAIKVERFIRDNNLNLLDQSWQQYRRLVSQSFAHLCDIDIQECWALAAKEDRNEQTPYLDMATAQSEPTEKKKITRNCINGRRKHIIGRNPLRGMNSAIAAMLKNGWYPQKIANALKTNSTTLKHFVEVEMPEYNELYRHNYKRQPTRSAINTPIFIHPQTLFE